MVTHDPIAASYADRVIFLADGTVVEDRGAHRRRGDQHASCSPWRCRHDRARPRRADAVREHMPSVLVAALSAAFGVALLQVTGVLAASIAGRRRDRARAAPSRCMLGIVAIVFIVIAVYVGAIVTANTVRHDRRRPRPLDRAAAPARLERVAPSAPRSRREGLFVGLVGAVIGAVVGTGVAIAARRGSPWRRSSCPTIAYGY